VVLTLAKGILIQVGKRSDLVGHFQIFHIVDFSSGEHISGFNGAFAHFLVNYSLVDLFLNGMGHSSGALVVVTLVCVLVSTNSSFVSPRVVNIVVPNDLRSGLLEHA